MAKKNKIPKEKKEKQQVEKQEVPILKNPTKSVAGKIVIWVLLLAMGLGGLAGIIYAIIQAV